MPQRVEFGINKIGGLVPNRMTCETLISLFSTCIGYLRSAIRSALPADQSEKPKTMQQISTRLSFGLVWAILVLTLGCASTHQTEDLLSAAGFKIIAANTPQQQQHLKTLPSHKMRRVHRKGKTYYVYADPAHNLIYVGNQLQYDQYRDLRLAKNVFEQDLQDAELNAQEAAGWEAWGPFY
jgi:hypothetical protein